MINFFSKNRLWKADFDVFLYKVTLFGVLSLSCLVWASPQSSIGSELSPCEVKVGVNGTTLNGLALPQLETDKEGRPYYVFEDFYAATRFMQEGHKVTRQNPEQRSSHLLPVLNGVLQLVKINGKHNGLTKTDVMHLISGISMWSNTISQINRNAYFPQAEWDLIYSVSISLAGSYLYQPLSNILENVNFNNVMINLGRKLPLNLLEKYLLKLPEAIEKTHQDKYLFYQVKLLPRSHLQPEDFKSWAKKILEADAKTDKTATVETMGFFLNNLFLLHPPSAWTYYVRNRRQLNLLDLDKGEIIVRPLAYFKYVMGHDVPDFDHKILLATFANPDQQATGIESQVAHWMDGMGIHYSDNHFEPEVPFLEMDFYTEIDGRRINIEVDGPHHFMEFESRNKSEPSQFKQRMEDVRRDEILNAVGIEVYRIPFWKMSSENFESTMEELLADLTKD